MNAIRKHLSALVRTILFAGLAAAMACPARGQLYDSPLMPYRGHGYARCYPFVSCWAYREFLILEQRRDQAEQLRRSEEPPAFAGIPNSAIQGTTPADEAEIQPDYIESGQIRDKYQGSGEVLPGVRPSR